MLFCSYDVTLGMYFFREVSVLDEYRSCTAAYYAIITENRAFRSPGWACTIHTAESMFPGYLANHRHLSLSLSLSWLIACSHSRAL